MNLSSSYSLVAKEYTKSMFDELAQKPKDREILDILANMLGEGASVCDLGCGPGQVARYLKSKKLNSFGIDISPGMIEQASKVNPDIEFQVGDMLSIPLFENSIDGVAAFYSLIHIAKEDLPKAFSEVKRVLKPGGVLLFSFHIGDETIHLDDWWNHKVNLDFHFFQTEEMKHLTWSSGLEITNVIERDPCDASVEHQSRRAYFFSRKPAT